MFGFFVLFVLCKHSLKKKKKGQIKKIVLLEAADDSNEVLNGATTLKIKVIVQI